MYAIVGVTQPKLDLAAMQARANAYTTLADGTESAHGVVTDAIDHVRNNNDGDATDAFTAQVRSGSESIEPYLEEMAAAANRTQQAYADGISAGTLGTLAMNIVATRRGQQYASALFSLDAPRALAIATQAQQELVTLESQVTASITTAFSDLRLPTVLSMTFEESHGEFDPAIEDEWQDLVDEDPEAAQEVLQQMADDYADQHGIPHVELDFTTSLGNGTWGVRNPDGSIQINLNHLDSVHILNTVIHEMEHSRQYYGMNEEGPWWRRPLGDVGGGMTAEEAARWRELNETYVREKGEGDGYNARPVEVGAREASRDYINNLSVEEFREFLP